MATFTAIRNKKQTVGSLVGVLRYISQEHKILWDNQPVMSGHNCVPYASIMEMLTTKKRFGKTGGRQFYHFVQSFSEQDGLTPWEVNALGVELAQKEFPDFEVIVATHVDANHLHNHLVVNSVSCETGRKLHQNTADLLAHRQANDEICKAHGLAVLDKPERDTQKKRMKPGEYQAGLREESWKMDLIRTINDVLEYALDRESFIENMENEGYQVSWTDNRKHITYTCPNGRKCRDNRLHDELLLKENLEILFAYRQAVGFYPSTAEPPEGWMGELVTELLRLGKTAEQGAGIPPLAAPPAWGDSKQRRREALKKLAMGQKLGGDQDFSVNF